MMSLRSLSLVVAALCVPALAVRIFAQEPRTDASVPSPQAVRTGRSTDQSVIGHASEDDAAPHRSAPRMEVLADAQW